MSSLFRRLVWGNGAVVDDNDADDRSVEDRNGLNDKADDTPAAFPALDSVQRTRKVEKQDEGTENDAEEASGSSAPATDDQTVATIPTSTAAPIPATPMVSLEPSSNTRIPTSLPSISNATPRDGARQLPTSAIANARGPPAPLQSRQPPPMKPVPKFSHSNPAVSSGSPTSLAVPGRMAPPPSLGAPSSASVHRQRHKVALEPGYSQLDWATLKSSGRDLSGTGAPPGRITLAELKQHRRMEDAWTALGGKVYNITPYMKFHPGGVKELMRCAGRDGTQLFNATHGWVNYDRMLSMCLVGYLIAG
ncbi:uncharacterized protein V1518DRAFT_412628 [Limtongia smithiae]|uniref:uncharacterized protein n=1 Tax=Limtongia smithiae TaxID=1125753 RepID=UPI0034CDE893